MSRTIVFRADADARMGSGHVMRCIALAQAAEDRADRCIFAATALPHALAARLRSERFSEVVIQAEKASAEDARRLQEIAAAAGATWIVVDGYGFSDDYHRLARRAGARLLAIRDDATLTPHAANIVLNHNFHASREFYAGADEDSLLLVGPRYALLRREFASGAPERSFPPVARRLLVTLGGSDPHNVTFLVLDALRDVAASVDHAEVVVVAGAMNEHVDELRQVAFPSGWKIEIVRDVQQMAHLMRRADLAVAASGSTTLELAATGLPSIVIPIADNQTPVARSLAERGAAIAMSSVPDREALAKVVCELIGDRRLREDLSLKGRQLVDGLGASRVVRAMHEYERAKAVMFALRPAVEADSCQIWEWANEPIARAVSFHSDPIPWEAHEKWIKRILSDPSHRLYIASNRDANIGQARFHMHDGAATISITLAAVFRGRGLGVRLIEEASRELFRTTAVASIEAFIKPTNGASLNVFRRAGFVERGSTLVNGQVAVRLELARSMLQ